MLVYDNSSVAIKNGRSDGTTAVAHNNKPSFAELRFVLEKITKSNVKIKKVIGSMFLFNEII